MGEVVRDAIARLDEIRTDLNAQRALTLAEVDELTHRTHLVWQLLANRPWVTPVRLRLSGAIFVMDETHLTDVESRETVTTTIGWCIEQLGRVEKMLRGIA